MRAWRKTFGQKRCRVGLATAMKQHCEGRSSGLSMSSCHEHNAPLHFKTILVSASQGKFPSRYAMTGEYNKPHGICLTDVNQLGARIVVIPAE